MKTMYAFIAIGSCLSVAVSAASAQDRMVYGYAKERIASQSRASVNLGEPTLRIQLLKGHQTNTIYFQPAGIVQVLVDRTQTTVAGTYTADGQNLCVTLPVRGRDCWAYNANAAQGTTETVRSQRGQRLKVTYLVQGADMASIGRTLNNPPAAVISAVPTAGDR